MPEFVPVTTQVFSLYGVQSRSCRSSRQRSGCRISVGCAGTTRPPSRVVRKHLSCLRLSTSGSRPRTGGSHPDPAGATCSPVRNSTRSSLPAPLSAPKILAGPASPPTGAAMNTSPTAPWVSADPLFVSPWRRSRRSGGSQQACWRTGRRLPDPSYRTVPFRGGRIPATARIATPAATKTDLRGVPRAPPTAVVPLIPRNSCPGGGGSSVRSQSPGTRIPGAQGVGQVPGLPISTPTTTGRPVSPIRRLDLRTRKRARPTPATASVVP